MLRAVPREARLGDYNNSCLNLNIESGRGDDDVGVFIQLFSSPPKTAVEKLSFNHFYPEKSGKNTRILAFATITCG